VGWVRDVSAPLVVGTAVKRSERAFAADNVARLRHVLGMQPDEPTVVAGHSYGGQVMTALGSDAKNVVALVYVAAFGLDEGESIGGLLTQGPPTPCARQPGDR
jgi:pimeloyl-ACP methyl ester carboxylesterase